MLVWDKRLALGTSKVGPKPSLHSRNCLAYVQEASGPTAIGFGLYPVERHFFARLYTRATLCSAQPKWAPTQAATTHMMRGSTERRSLWHWSFTAFPIWAQPDCARTYLIGARPKWCTTQKSATQWRAILKARGSVFSWPSKAPPSLART